MFIALYETIFIHGKQKRIKRPPTIEGLSVEEFIRRNADPIWLHQNGMWEYMEPWDEMADAAGLEPADDGTWDDEDGGELPF